MFAESLVESNAQSRGHRRQLATAFSISMEALLLAAVMAVAAFRPAEVLFSTRSLPAPLLLPRVTPIVPEQVSQSEASEAASSRRPIYVVPSTTSITYKGAKPRAIEETGIPMLAIPGASAGNPLVGVLGSGKGTGGVRGPERPVLISHLTPGQLISRTEPQYPPIARNARIEGEVVLTAIIGKSGQIESLQLKSGHPLLARAAIDAVRRWRYRPYILNGGPVEVQTQITVNFKLGRT